jgi:hypothetical protein
MARTSFLLGVSALVLCAVSWSWIVGVGITPVRIGEIGALLAGVAAVLSGAVVGWRTVGVGLGVAALVLVIGLNLLGVLFF